MFQLLTPHLVLRDMVAEDTALVEALSAEPLVTRYQTWLRLDDAQHAQRWVADVMHHNASEPRGAYNLAIVERGTNVGIGWLGWGYALLPTFWNRGFTSEALAAILRWAFENTERTRIYGECAAVCVNRFGSSASLVILINLDEAR